jgi:peptidoglycan hydrolase-like protein with peptidoglycan-binding domain
MRPSFSSILILTCFFYLGLLPKQTIANTTANTAKPISVMPIALNPNARGAEVQVLQVQLKALGYYNGVIDGQYGLQTQDAVAKFQKAKNLKRIDGVADSTTRKVLEITLASGNNAPTTSTPSPPQPPASIQVQPTEKNYLLWIILGCSSLGSLAVFIYWKNWYLKQKLNQVPIIQQATISEQKILSAANDESVALSLQSATTEPIPLAARLLPPTKTNVLARVDIVDELIKDLRSSDPTKRRKAVWTLGQQGDSRAIQPLLDLMIDADSHQHGLVLSALTEIGLRTLKPMHRALAISMQHDSPQVRQNAIRDLARIYDMMGQMSHILRHAIEDTDPEVQATAKYALNHINRMRLFPEHSPNVADFSEQHG